MIVATPGMRQNAVRPCPICESDANLDVNVYGGTFQIVCGRDTRITSSPAASWKPDCSEDHEISVRRASLVAVVEAWNALVRREDWTR